MNYQDAKILAKSLAPKHYISGLEGGPEFLDALLHLAQALKASPQTAINDAPLSKKVFTGLFLNPSLRTRTSFEVALHKLGGHMVTLAPGSGSWAMEFDHDVTMDGNKAEHIIEAAGALSGYSDILGLRAFASMENFQDDMLDLPIKALAKHASSPVISMESAMWHPCQALADALTLKETFGPTNTPKKFTLTWAKHPKMCGPAVPHSALLAAVRQGFDVTLAHPEGYDLHPSVLDTAHTLAASIGTTLSISHDIDHACQGADVIYAKAWGSPQDYGNPTQGGARNMAHENWTVTQKLLDQAHFMHCLPIRRGVVAQAAILDGDRSLVQTQANNRLWGQMALLIAMAL